MPYINQSNSNASIHSNASSRHASNTSLNQLTSNNNGNGQNSSVNSGSGTQLHALMPTRHDSIVKMLSTPPPNEMNTAMNEVSGNLMSAASDINMVDNTGKSEALDSTSNADKNSNKNDSSILSPELVENLHISKNAHPMVQPTLSNSSISSNSSIEDSAVFNQLSHLTEEQQKKEKLVLKVHKKSWQHIKLSSLVEPNKLITINGQENSVEMAFNKLIEHNLTSIPVESFPGDMNCLTFDYNDLNSYLLLVLNKIKVNDMQIMKDCQSGKPVAVGEIIKLTPKNPFYKIPECENLSAAMSILGTGVHRIAITDLKQSKIEGILSQRRLIKYLWDNARKFDNFENLLNMSLKDLKIGVFGLETPQYKKKINPITGTTMHQSRVISINGDEPLINALYKMHEESISSIAVIDNSTMLLGNISVTDVKHVTRTSQFPLLHNTCRHFISVILNSRGLEMGGKDSFPIFHVYPNSSLARTMAKIVATKSHRLWIVEPPNQQFQSSPIQTPSASGNIHFPAHQHRNSLSSEDLSGSTASSDFSNYSASYYHLNDNYSNASASTQSHHRRRSNAGVRDSPLDSPLAKVPSNGSADYPLTQSPLTQSPMTQSPMTQSPMTQSPLSTSINTINTGTPVVPTSSNNPPKTTSASAGEGLGIGAGKLIGVVSLSDILGLFVRNELNSLVDPQTARRQRSIVSGYEKF
ncbi:hypothetical protein ACO0QE_003682 [Hanseniaspora vineae]